MMIKTLFIISSLFTLFFFVKLLSEILGEKIQYCENKQEDLKKQLDDLVYSNKRLYKQQDQLFWEMVDKVNKIQEQQILNAKAEKHIGKIDNV